MSDFVHAVNANGDLQLVPAHWIGHPVFGADFKLPPSARKAAPEPAPTDPATKAKTEKE